MIKIGCLYEYSNSITEVVYAIPLGFIRSLVKKRGSMIKYVRFVQSIDGGIKTSVQVMSYDGFNEMFTYYSKDKVLVIQND